MFKKVRGGGELFHYCVRGVESRRKKQNGLFPIKPLHGASNSIKGHSSVDLMPNASKMFLPKKSVFFERTRKATHLKAGENFLPFTWVSETSIMQRHKHLTEWKIRGATLAGDQRASASGGIKQALSRSP